MLHFQIFALSASLVHDRASEETCDLSAQSYCIFPNCIFVKWAWLTHLLIIACLFQVSSIHTYPLLEKQLPQSLSMILPWHCFILWTFLTCRIIHSLLMVFEHIGHLMVLCCFVWIKQCLSKFPFDRVTWENIKRYKIDKRWRLSKWLSHSYQTLT